MAAAMVAGAVPQTALAASAEEMEESTEAVAGEQTEKESEETTFETVERETEEATSQESTEEIGTSEESTSEAAESETEEKATEEEVTEEETTEEDATKEEVTEEVTEDATEEVTIEDDDSAKAKSAVNKALRFKMEPVTAWKDFIQQDVTGFSDLSFEDGVDPEYSISYDLYIPKTVAFEGSYWVKTVTKLGAGWTWTESGSGENVGRDSFKECAENDSLVKYTYKGKIGAAEARDFDIISAIVIAVGSSEITYDGALFVDNVTLYNEKDEVVRVVDFDDSADAFELGDLSGMEPTDLPEVDGEIALSMDKSAWSDGGEWEYTGTKTIANKTIGDKSFLQIGLDYSNDVEKSWAEAKLEYTHPETVESMNGYNTFKADVYYAPGAMSAGGFKIKVYSKELGINDYPDLPKGTAVEGVEGLDGYYKSEFVLNYPSKRSLSR